MNQKAAFLLVCLIASLGTQTYARTLDFQDDAIETTEYLADALNIEEERAELHRLAGKPDPALSARINFLQNRITHKLLVDFFEINSTVAEITDELDKVEHKIAVIEHRRQVETETINVAAFASTGTLGIIGNSLNIPSNASQTVPAIFGVIGSSMSLGLSVAATLLNRNRHIKVPGGKPNVLIYVFDANSTAPRFPLPGVVCEYLHRKSEEKLDTRANKLIALWKKHGLLKTCSQEEIAEVCQLNSPKLVTLDLLRRQSTMMRNLRALLLQTNKGLMKLAEQLDEETQHIL